MKKTLKINDVMTPMPFSVRQDETVTKAKELMVTHRIRHLLVKKEGKLVGIISDRDINVALCNDSSGKLAVEDFMEPNVYTVFPHAPLPSVVFEMASKKYGCVVIEEKGQTVGIFTSIDALGVLGELLGG